MDVTAKSSVEIVVPLFNEEANVVELHERLLNSCQQLSIPWMVTFVDDGSGDRTAAMLEAICDADARFQVLHLSRNFGHQPAITAGLSHVDADAVVLLDGDLQDPPELIPELVQAWLAGAEVVIARRRSRQETGLRRICFELFHRFFRYLVDIEVPPHTGTFGLLAGEALRTLNALPEAHRFFPGLRAWVGFQQVTVEYDRANRSKGEPKQTFRRLFRYASDGVFSFSLKPLRLMTTAGVLVCSIGFFFAASFFIKRLLGWEQAPTGFTTLICAIFGLGGIQLVGLGVLGEYVGRIYEQSKMRPLFVVRDSQFKARQSRRAPQRAA